jgi:cell division protein FtsL
LAIGFIIAGVIAVALIVVIVGIIFARRRALGFRNASQEVARRLKQSNEITQS